MLQIECVANWTCCKLHVLQIAHFENQKKSLETWFKKATLLATLSATWGAILWATLRATLLATLRSTLQAALQATLSEHCEQHCKQHCDYHYERHCEQHYEQNYKQHCNNGHLHLDLLPVDPFSGCQRAGLKTLKHVTDICTYIHTDRRTDRWASWTAVAPKNMTL